jgi:hypothetical protein
MPSINVPLWNKGKKIRMINAPERKTVQVILADLFAGVSKDGINPKNRLIIGSAPS